MIIRVPVDPNHQAFPALDKIYIHCRDTVIRENHIGLEWDSKSQKIDWMFESMTNSKIHYNNTDWAEIEFQSESDYIVFLLTWS